MRFPRVKTRKPALMLTKILHYLAAHTFAVNLDSYSSNVSQDYYIYPNDTKLLYLWKERQDHYSSVGLQPCSGCFQSGSAPYVVNFPIDTLVGGVEMSSRLLTDKLLSNKEYLEKYRG